MNKTTATKYKHTHTQNCHCWSAFHIQIRMIASGLCVCVCVCISYVFDFSVLFHAECINALMLLLSFFFFCFCCFFLLFQKCLLKSPTLTVFYLSFQYILYQYSNKCTIQSTRLTQPFKLIDELHASSSPFMHIHKMQEFGVNACVCVCMRLLFLHLFVIVQFYNNIHM